VLSFSEMVGLNSVEMRDCRLLADNRPVLLCFDLFLISGKLVTHQSLPHI
jgi:hypothetical protein